jgi:L-alanine-DL-glutamate epimerase-like enolase superfamily enzyme
LDQTIRIERVQVDQIDPGPLNPPFMDSTMGPFERWSIAYLRLTADDGTVGQAPMGISPLVLDALLTESPLTIEQWWTRLWWLQRNAGHRNPTTTSTMAAVEAAMVDILAKRAGLPWHRYLGGKRDTVPVYGSGGGTNRPLDELVAEMRSLVAAGYDTVKMKVGKQFGTRMDEDVDRVKAVRQAIGPAIKLAVDANQIWSADEARTFARRIADLDIAWFEEPVHSADRKATRDLCRDCPMPVAMGESENHWLGFRDLQECGVPHLQPPPHGVPGWSKWREAVAFGREAGTWSSGGQARLTAYFVATQPDGLVENLHSIGELFAGIWKTCPQIERGQITLPATPGFAYEVDWLKYENAGTLTSVIDRKA